MNYIYHGLNDSNLYLSHHGIKGQKWGIRRYQNADGSLTDEGYRHYGYGKKSRFIPSPNTVEQIKRGAKSGATVGLVKGVGSALIFVAANSGALTPAALALYGGAIIADWTATGALTGITKGTILGLATTHNGRKKIENDPNLNVKIKEIEKSKHSE